MPSWSRDGRRIDFMSERSGSSQFWRIPAEGGVEELVTTDGAALVALESMDGRTLFYRRARGSSALMARSLAGGVERTVVGCVSGRASFASSRTASTMPTARRGHSDCIASTLRPAATRVLGTLERRWGNGFAVSPDGRTILYDRIMNDGSDLMLIEGFR